MHFNQKRAGNYQHLTQNREKMCGIGVYTPCRIEVSSAEQTLSRVLFVRRESQFDEMKA